MESAVRWPIPVHDRIAHDEQLLSRVGLLQEELLVASPRGRGEGHQKQAQTSQAELKKLARRQAECLDSLRWLQMDAEAIVAAGPHLAQLEFDATHFLHQLTLSRDGGDCDQACSPGASSRPCTDRADIHEDWVSMLESILERLKTLGRVARIACGARTAPGSEESSSEEDALDPANVTERIQSLLDRLLQVHAEGNSQVLEGQARTSVELENNDLLQFRVQALEAENSRLRQRVVDAEKGLLIQRAVGEGGGYEHLAAHFRTDPAFDSLHLNSHIGLLPRVSVRSCFRKAQPCNVCGQSPGVVFGLAGLGIWQRRHKKMCNAEDPAMSERPDVTSQNQFSRQGSYLG
eukprot:TRINITY_DN75182_c0_g1_i1.p1 TRINITY_DN75182_c0_g1~~TRINITY_DN75182_c0_g1_i1.p1  ORF type:complete len:363 (+),score=48.60 TRINITY_DN75182_c0_g1_i1:46-1089(+)